MKRFLVLAISFVLVAFLVERGQAADIYVGSGCKAGEVTDTTAIVLVRLTATPGQDDKGNIPGREGEARLEYGPLQSLAGAMQTPWQSVDPKADWSIHFQLRDLRASARYFYRVEYRTSAIATSERSDLYSFVTAPPPNERAAVQFILTTCQDLRGFNTYVPMTAQNPDFCISDGDNVYYDGQGDARNVPEAWQAYQQMFGLPPMKEFYRNVSGYFLKDDHDYRFNDCDPHMKGVWVNAAKKGSPKAKFMETQGNRKLDVNWLSAEDGARVFGQVFPMSEKPYRTFRWGRGIQLWLLENREFRSPNDAPDGPEKTIWGAEQKAWLKKTLLASDADFRIIVSPNPIIGPDRIMKGDNQANINGFWYEGQAFLDWLIENKLTNVVLMNGDRHWQYHSIDKRHGRNIPEFSCGPTDDDHVQPVPPPYDGVDRPYSASRGGFLTIKYDPSRALNFQFFSVKGEGLYEHTIR
jgi:phosphodiesterase/alkaline phosphatase D-like protein